jgi:hypothetical protein
MTLTVKLTRHIQRTHWTLAGRGRIGRVYLAASNRLVRLRDDVEFAAWRRWRWRPRLDAAIASELARAGTPADSDRTIEGRLVARVAFHLKPTRIKYLVETLTALRALPFRQIHITIDTNTHETARLLAALGVDLADAIDVHDRLADPLKLTWMHRKPMARVVEDYDYFLYIEDDILLTPQSVRLWHERLPILKSHGYLPGFLRVEFNRRRELMTSDFPRHATPDEVVMIDGQPYLHSPFPYQAFWLYDRETMRAFVASELYRTGHPGVLIRECMAFGCTYERTAEGWRSRHLVPMLPARDGAPHRIDPRGLAFHAPSNFASLIVPHPSGLGVIPVEGLIKES